MGKSGGKKNAAPALLRYLPTERTPSILQENEIILGQKRGENCPPIKNIALAGVKINNPCGGQRPPWD